MIHVFFFISDKKINNVLDVTKVMRWSLSCLKYKPWPVSLLSRYKVFTSFQEGTVMLRCSIQNMNSEHLT